VGQLVDQQNNKFLANTHVSPKEHCMSITTRRSDKLNKNENVVDEINEVEQESE